MRLLFVHGRVCSRSHSVAIGLQTFFPSDKASLFLLLKPGLSLQNGSKGEMFHIQRLFRCSWMGRTITVSKYRQEYFVCGHTNCQH